MGWSEFSASLLQFSVSHDSKIILIDWFGAKYFIIIFSVENDHAALYFQNSLMNIKLKRIAFKKKIIIKK